MEHTGRNRNIIVLVVCLLLGACLPKQRYRVMSFFFDGVPQPEQGIENRADANDTVPVSVDTEGVPAPGSHQTKPVTIVRHKPYRDRACSRCHDRTSSSYLRMPIQALCFSCHDRTPFVGAYVHGPVAVRQCLACHEPHQSENPDLLKYPDENLCFMCHKESTIRTIRGHENRKRCLNCHDPHAYNNPFFLLPDAAAKLGEQESP